MRAWALAACLLVAAALGSPGQQPADEAASLRQIAALLNQGRAREALPLARETLRSIEERGQEGDLLVVACVALGRVQLALKAWSDAVAPLSRALAVLERGQAPDAPACRGVRELLRDALNGSGRVDEAIALYDSLLRRVISIRRSRHPSSLVVLDQLVALCRGHDDARALRYQEEVVAVTELAQGAESLATARALVLLAGVHRDLRDAESATSLLLRGRTIIASDSNAPPRFLIQVDRWLGECASDLSRHDETVRWLSQALARSEQALEPADSMIGELLASLAEAHLSFGDAEQGLVYRRQALAHAQLLPGEQGVILVNALVALSRALPAAGGREEALLLLDRGLALTEEGSHAWSMVVGALAQRHEADGQLTLALDAVRRLERWLRATEPVNETELTAVLIREAELYTALENQDSAEECRREAEEMLRRLLAARSDDATALVRLADLLAARGEDVEAGSLYTAALAIVLPIRGELDATVLELRIALFFNQLISRRDVDGALAQRAPYLDSIDRHFAHAILAGSYEQKIGIVRQLETDLATTISVLTNVAPENPEALRQAVNAVLRRKGRTLDALCDNMAAARTLLSPPDAELVAHVSSVRAALSTAILAGPGDDLTLYQTRVDELRKDLSATERRLAARVADAIGQPVGTDLARIQRALPSHAVLAEFVEYQPLRFKGWQGQHAGGPRYLVFVVTQKVVTWLDLGPTSDLDAAVRDFLIGLRRSMGGKAIGRDLHARIIEPIERAAGGLSRLLIAPDSALSLLPFGALIDAEGNYLADRLELAYINSGRDLLARVGPPSTRPALLLGDPIYDHPGREELATLPHTSDEVRTIAGQVGEADVRVSKQASERALRETHGPRFLHIATHGFFHHRNLAAQDPALWLLNSGLLLSRPDGAGTDEDDGVLTALEAASLDLRGTRLVVLSACETGMGDVRQADGVYGLRRAFTIAGAQSQIVSLWRVDSDATRLLMINLYEALSGGATPLEPCSALKSAQLALRRISREERDADATMRQGRPVWVVRRPFDDPFYWAAWQAWGVPRSWR